MFAMFGQLFTALTVLCKGLENFAKSFMHLSTIAEQKAKAYADECAIENETALHQAKVNAAAQKDHATANPIAIPAPANQ